MGLANFRRKIWCNQTLDRRRGFAWVSEGGWLRTVHSVNCDMHSCPQVSTEPQIHNWQMIQSTLVHHVQNSTYVICHETGQSGTVMLLINRLQLIFVIIDNQECQCKLPLAIPISDHLCISKWQREWLSLCSIVCLTNDLFDYWYQLRRYIGWLSKEVYFDKAS